MDYIKDNGMMEKLPFWKFGGKSSSAEKYLFENENSSGQMLLYNVLPGIKLVVTELNGSTMNFYHSAVSSVAEIAAAAGYGSQSKFAASFKQVMQLAPSEYRMRYGKK